MKQIRNKVFETNSSSTHSVSIENSSLVKDPSNLGQDFYKKIPIQFGEFGWEDREYTDQLTKFKYLCTMWWLLEGQRCKNIEDLILTEGYQLLNKAIKDNCNNEGLTITKETGIVVQMSYDNKPELDIAYGYIDHQSMPWSPNKDEVFTLKRWLKQEAEASAEDFIFSKDVVLKTSNDNECSSYDE
jgi:hypothetical protein